MSFALIYSVIRFLLDALLTRRTHQGSVDEAQLPVYLDKFVFRFNRRRSRSRGLVFYRLLELAVCHDPVHYRDLIAARRPRIVPLPPPRPSAHPSGLDRPVGDAYDNAVAEASRDALRAHETLTGSFGWHRLASPLVAADPDRVQRHEFR